MPGFQRIGETARLVGIQSACPDLDERHGGIVTGHNGGAVLVGLHDPDGIEIRLYAN